MRAGLSTQWLYIYGDIHKMNFSNEFKDVKANVKDHYFRITISYHPAAITKKAE